MILTAPPLLQDTVILAVWRTIQAFIFRKATNQSNVPSQTSAPPAPPDDPAFHQALDTLTRLQEHNGLYTDLGGLIRGLNINLPPDNWNPPTQAQQFVGQEDTIWATAIAVAYLMNKFPLQWTTWGRFARKIREAGKCACGGDETVFSEIVQCAFRAL